MIGQLNDLSLALYIRGQEYEEQSEQKSLAKSFSGLWTSDWEGGWVK